MATKKSGSVKKTDTLLTTSVTLSSEVTGTLGTANGGTGQSSFTDGQILVGVTSGNTLAKVSVSGDATLSSAGVLTIANSAVTNAKLANSAVTIGSTSVSLGATASTIAGLTLTTPNLGTPSAATLTNATGLPISTGVSGLGTGVATALAVNVGSAGAVVTNGGALGTPSSGTLTNATGLPISTGVSGLGTGVATFLATPSSANLASAVTDETGSGALVFGTSPTIAGGSITALTTFGIRSSGTGAFDLRLANTENLTANRILTITVGDAARTLTLGGNATLNGGTHSGTNTGDQTITLTGDVTGSGTGSFAATIANSAVTNAKLANSAITIAGTSTSLGGSISLDTITGLASTGIVRRSGANTLAIAAAGTDFVAPGAVTSSGLTMATARLLGRSTASTGAIEEITVGSGLSLSAGTLSATGGSGITVGSTTITSGTSGRFAYNSSNVYAETGSGITTDGTNATFGSGNLRATSPRITTSILDSNGNTVLGLTATSSATQSLTLANATATNAVSLTATAPTQATSTQAGTGISITASNATAGSSSASVAAGGTVTITTGNAAALSSSTDARAGDFEVVIGSSVGTNSATLKGQMILPTQGRYDNPSICFRTTGFGVQRFYGVGLDNGGNVLSVSAPQTLSLCAGDSARGNTVGYVLMNSQTFVSWVSGTSNPYDFSADLLIGRRTTANLQLGAQDVDTNASVVAQTLSVQGVTTGGTSNQAGKNFTIAGSRGKGTGAGGSIIFQVTMPGSTGTTLNTLQNTLTLAGDADRSATFAGLIYAGAATTQLTNANGNLQVAAFGSQSPNVFLAGPSSGSGNPSFRSLVLADFSNGLLTHAKLTIPYAEAEASSSQTISNATNTAVNLQTEIADNDSIHSTVSNTSRMTIVTAGKYLITATVPWNTVPGACRIIPRLYKNGTSGTVLAGIDQQIASGTPSFNLTAVADLVANDYVEIYVYHDAGSSFGLYNDSTLKARMSVLRVG